MNKQQLLEQRTMLFARQCLEEINKIPYSETNKVLMRQLARSSTSIGANYMEANESLSKKDLIYRLKICRKESKETLYWLNLLDYNSASSNLSSVKQEAKELFLIFCKTILNLERKKS